jgi:hypothetical protein
MDDNFYLSIHPGGFDLEHLPGDPQSITIRRVGGETVTLDPQQDRLEIHTEHPPVERMEGDWGAICEVFRKSSYYYASISGVRLAAGDQITIRYKRDLGEMTLKVVDIENGRARVNPPEINASSAASDDRQNP